MSLETTRTTNWVPKSSGWVALRFHIGQDGCACSGRGFRGCDRCTPRRGVGLLSVCCIVLDVFPSIRLDGPEIRLYFV
jgi:hypothetical protein